MAERPGHDLEVLTRETQAIWNTNAAFWDERFGEGNAFHRTIIAPPTERLLGIRPGERVLDVGCGNGTFSRRLAELGAEVVACDFSAQFIALAERRTVGHPAAGRIAYRVLDATDADALATLGAARFDAAVATMVLMDMATIAPLLAALRRALRPGGRFVFSVSHPCFHSVATSQLVERKDREGEIVTSYAVKVRDYLDLAPTKGIGIVGQPVPHYYFDRPLSVLLGEAFRAGFVLDGLEEPRDPTPPRPDRPLGWENMPGIPPALVARLRPSPFVG